MCKPIAIGQSDEFHHSNQTLLLKRNAIESENEIHLNTSTTDTMRLSNITLSSYSFGLDSTKNGTFVVKWKENATQTTEHASEAPFKESLSTFKKVANNSVNASQKLNLATMNVDDQRNHTSNFKHLLKSLAKAKTNIKSTGQDVDATETPPINLNVQNATQQSTVTKFNTLNMLGQKITHTSETAAKLPVMQMTHQSTITTKATIQSVFLDYSNNFNGTKSQQQFDKINHNVNGRGNNQSQTQSGNEEILSRTERSVQLMSNQRKKLHNDTGNGERIERSANFSLTRSSRRIQLLLKGRFLQMLPDGTVNGTQNDQSEYSK